MPLTLAFLALALIAPNHLYAAPEADKDLAQQIFDTMLQLPGNKPGNRLVHAKGIVCQGTFAPSKDAASISQAGHFNGATVPVIFRFSDNGPDPGIADISPDSAPRGMAIRFKLPDGKETDIVAFSHNGFPVGTGEEFLGLQKAIVATRSHKASPLARRSVPLNTSARFEIRAGPETNACQFCDGGVFRQQRMDLHQSTTGEAGGEVSGSSGCWAALRVRCRWQKQNS